MTPIRTSAGLLVIASFFALGAGSDGPSSVPSPANAAGAIAVPPPSSTPARGVDPHQNRPIQQPTQASAPQPARFPSLQPQQFTGPVQTVALFALVSLVPVAVLMFTAFVRISIVLTLLRQALGSPQVPGNQVLTALALLLTLLVMKPVADQVYRLAIVPYANEQLSAEAAFKAGSDPVKKFMIDQIFRTGHQHYLRELYDYTEPPNRYRVEPATVEELELRVVAPAFLLSELTTALVMGFAIYLPFLVIDLVVSAVLVAMGLFMLPPTLVALPLKLIVFVLADGWMLVAGMLLRSFAQ
jgi:flagellar biosynthetic protein FliP